MDKDKKPKDITRKKSRGGRSVRKGKRQRKFGRYYKGPDPTKDNDLSNYNGKLFRRYLDLGFDPDEVRKKIASLNVCPPMPPGLPKLRYPNKPVSSQLSTNEIRLLKKYCRKNGIRQSCQRYFMNKLERGVEPEVAMQQAILFREVSACYKPISHDKPNLKDFCRRKCIHGKDSILFNDLIKKGYKPNEALLELKGGDDAQQQTEHKNLTWRRGVNNKYSTEIDVQPSRSSIPLPQRTLHIQPFASTIENKWDGDIANGSHPTNPFSSFTTTSYDDKTKMGLQSPKSLRMINNCERGRQPNGLDSSSSKFYVPALKANSCTQNTLNCVKVAVLPRRYPQETLEEVEMHILENAIIEEVGRRWEVNIQIRCINFKQNMLVIDCENLDTVQWLRYVTPRLNAWEGVELEARVEEASSGDLFKN